MVERIAYFKRILLGVFDDITLNNFIEQNVSQETVEMNLKDGVVLRYIGYRTRYGFRAVGKIEYPDGLTIAFEFTNIGGSKRMKYHVE